ncbi:MAG: aldo/keto reductase [Actinomycetales bacterium]|nr:aldo/keto reductase [Actinomycetales bacterium]
MTTIPTLSLTPDVSIPLLGFGTWLAEGDAAYRSVSEALSVGYRHIDTATAYGNEKQVGRAIAESGVDRFDLFVTTKLPPDVADHADETLAASLDKLGLDHLDLWLVHWPPNGEARPDVWERFIAARDGGRTRAIGVSNYSPDQIDVLTKDTGVTPAIDQIPWSPADYDPVLVAALTDRGVALEGYSPFKRTNLGDPVLAAIAAEHEATPAQVVLRWHLQHSFVAIPKSETPERIAANFAVGFELTDTEMKQVDGLGRAV